MSFFFTQAFARLMSGTLAFDQSDDLRALLFTTGSTAAVDSASGRDAFSLAEMTGLNEYTSASYLRKSLVAESIVTDLTNNWVRFSAFNLTWSGLLVDDFARQAIGLIIYKHQGVESSNIPAILIDNAPLFPFFGNGSNVTISWNNLGIIRIRNL